MPGMHIYLAWGFRINRENPWNDPKYDSRWEYFYAAQLNVVSRSQKGKSWAQYWDQVNEIVKQSGCEIDFSGHNDWISVPQYVMIKESKISVSLPQETPIPTTLTTKENWTQKLRDFCQIIKITWKEPKWFLAGYCG